MPQSFSATVDAMLTGLSGWPIYLTVGLLAFGEAAAFVGLVLPGETALLVGGVLAAQGHANLGVLLVVGVLAAIAGDSVGYEIGRIAGPALRRSRAGRWIGQDRWRRAEDLLTRRGSSAVLLGRWVGVLRALVPAVAGATRMPYRRFLLANAIGGALWTLTVVMVGFAAGAAWHQVQGWLGIGGIALAVAGLLAMIGPGLWRRWRAGRSSEHELPHARFVDTARSTPFAERTGIDTTTTLLVHAPAPSANCWARRWAPAAVAAGMCIALTAAVWDAAHEGADVGLWDQPVLSWMVHHRSPVSTFLARLVTDAASTPGVLVLTILAAIMIAWRWRSRQAVVVLIGAVATSAITSWTLKNLTARARPPIATVLGNPSPSFAFPSGHTLSGTVLLGTFALLVMIRTDKHRTRAIVAVGAAVGSLMVGLSRLYLGYHWFTDVLASWLIAGAILAVVAVLVRLLTDRQRQLGGCVLAGISPGDGVERAHVPECDLRQPCRPYSEGRSCLLLSAERQSTDPG